jgi:prepilin-type processing-associated H-X9-DG protein
MNRSKKWTDCVVLGVLVLLAATFTLAAGTSQREIAHRVKCASNLRQIGQALLLYSNENRGVFPRTTFVVDAKPVWGTPYEGNEKLAAKDGADPFSTDKSKAPETAVKPNDVTAALFQLLRTQDVTSEIFICPSAAGRTKWDFGGGANTSLNWSNWQGFAGLRDHLSYSYQNPYPSKEAIGKGFKLNNSISAEVAVMADMNPGGEALLKLTVQSPMNQMRLGNSFNHQRDGQNMLFGDGHVEFGNSPFFGTARDNIYTFGKGGGATPGGKGIVGSPEDADDTILLPTAADLGLKEEDLFEKLGAAAKPVNAENMAAVQARLVGKYQRGDTEAKLNLEVTDQKITLSTGPVTLSYNYKPVQIDGDKISLELTAPDTPAATTIVTIEKDGVSFSESSEFNGKWVKK